MERKHTAGTKLGFGRDLAATLNPLKPLTSKGPRDSATLKQVISKMIRYMYPPERECRSSQPHYKPAESRQARYRFISLPLKSRLARRESRGIDKKMEVNL